MPLACKQCKLRPRVRHNGLQGKHLQQWKREPGEKDAERTIGQEGLRIEEQVDLHNTALVSVSHGDWVCIKCQSSRN